MTSKASSKPRSTKPKESPSSGGLLLILGILGVALFLKFQGGGILPTNDPAPFVTPNDGKTYTFVLENAGKTPEPMATWTTDLLLEARKTPNSLIRKIHYEEPQLLDEPWKTAYDILGPPLKETDLPLIAISRNGHGWKGTPTSREELLNKFREYATPKP